MAFFQNILQRIEERKQIILQLVFVILAFVLMVVSSSVFVRNMLREHLQSEASEILLQTKLKAEIEFDEPQTLLLTVSQAIRNKILNGSSAEEIFSFMQELSDELENKPSGYTFDGIFGYFEIFDGVYYNTTEWEVPEDYIPTERQWYATAVEAGGNLAITPVYWNIRANDYVATYVRQIFDDDGQALGIICLNMPLDRVREFAAGMNLTPGTYGVLYDEYMNVYYHPEPQLIGMNSLEVSGGVAHLATEALAGVDFFEHPTINYEGQPSIVFSTRFQNGWVLYVVIPLAEYYQRLHNMMFMLIGFGTFFALALCAILIRVDNARRAADLEVFSKGLLEVALREAQEANTAKSKFLATMSHEIRTPMNVILGITDSMLMDDSHPKKIREAFEKVFNSGHLLLGIINDILDLSKIESGKFELVPVKYDVLSLINDTSNMCVMQFGHKQIQFKLIVDENIPLHLFGDELRIKQVLNNLLSNAFKYTNTGEVELSFNSEKIDENKVMLIANVRDTGQGMTPEQVSKLFDEYSRFNLEANRKTVGTGLGMAITRNLIKMMGGELKVESTPGVGSVFTVHIPQEVTAWDTLGIDAAKNLQEFNFSDTKREQHSKISRQPMPYGKVLIVDDIPANLDVASLLLAPYQIKTDTAGSGFEALDIIKSGKEYDIVFMDHMMPEMDGLETTKKIREWGYQGTIIALTANAVAGQQEMFLANGFDSFISKPIDIRQMNDTLNKFVRDKEIKRRRDAGLPEDLDVAIIEEDISVSDAPKIDIQGLDSQTGLSLYGGDFNAYCSVMRSFVPNALALVAKLENVSEENLATYAIDVHGLKGISGWLGAEEIKSMAEKLEFAAKAGNLKEVTENNSKLLADVSKLAAEIKSWLEKFDSQSDKPVLEKPDINLLSKLKTACENYDMDAIDEIMEELEKSNYKEDADLVAWLRERVNESDFDGIAERISEYL